MKLYSIGDFAEKIGRTEQTLRNGDKNNKFKPHHVSVGGTRYYSQEQLNHFLGIRNKEEITKKVIGYCRVSSHKQKDDLERQIENVKMLICRIRCIRIYALGVLYQTKVASAKLDT
ncbi:recombinase family protein [Bacillus cereus]|uniref:recombinase family protein n=1 Tax=Bacillus cereus TaxID=1396 RepID=UPI00249213FE|nr:MerR family transcriptional regulator [Bacillus cereus]